MTRDQRQSEVIEKWKQANGVGCFLAITGFGKSRVALKISKRIKDAYNKWPNMLVVVPTDYLRDQWNERIEKFNLQNIEVETIQQILSDYRRENITRSCQILVPDEIHKYTAEQFGRLYDLVNYKRVLGLTATIPDDERKEFINQYAPVFDVVDLEEALQNDWVSEFIVYKLPIELSNDERAEYNALNEKYHNEFAHFGHDFGTVQRVLSDDNFAKQWAEQMGNPGQAGRYKGHAARVMGNIQKRKSLLYNLDSKIKAATSIIEKFPEKLTVCFSERTDFATRLADAVGDRAVSYHSKVDDREQAVQRFSNPDESVNVLSTAKALDHGVDIPDISMAIITSGSSKSLQSIQRVGRSIRYQENKRAIVVDIYAENTQDEQWVRKRYRDFPAKTTRTINSIRDIQDI